MIELLLALWPLFALIVAGYYLRRWAFPNEAFWPGAERLNYFVLFPALLLDRRFLSRKTARKHSVSGDNYSGKQDA